MREFSYARASGISDSAGSPARLIAGGTNLLDLMKLEVEIPDRLLDINHIGLDQIDEVENGLRIGALVRNADCAANERVRRDYPLLARAILAGASPQLRNRATTGGNLCQRTRCGYFMRLGTRCNKREPGSGCDAIDGINREHAIFGASPACIATYPGDMAVALCALDATVQITGTGSSRSVPVRGFHRLPGDDPSRDNVLERGEIITSVTLPPPAGGRQVYRKVRDRASYAFALVSVACVLGISEGLISRANLAFGGVAHKPWHDPAVEKVLLGERPSPQLFARAADLLVAQAKGQGDNDFKIPLLHRALIATLIDASGA
ncbi:xanthine dehydrogenase family protein subunit M [Paracoccus sp. CPCC 101403]|uniref:Xanthine dehydrogenase family protein subunit M n=1 Tax=Paracoccus broussonetiae TaxID=3075834 RepID=A0ABU3EKG1_9RHOB|nr:xanthine dehydrogenase family protein subunit M [Paracoccus sp. CPCC 101403]MDT1064742.1 xanthine dehydrogenase family protein subunit M [Paracoccus sp. CPCC 101403]